MLLHNHFHIISYTINNAYNLFSRLQRRQYTFHLTLPSMVQQRVLSTVHQLCTSISTTITSQNHARSKCKCRCKIFNKPAAFSYNSNNSSNNNNSNSNNDRPSTYCCECFPEDVARTSRLCCTGAKVGTAIRYPRPLFVDRTRSSAGPLYWEIVRRTRGWETIREDSSIVFSSFHCNPRPSFNPFGHEIRGTVWEWVLGGILGIFKEVRNIFIEIYWREFWEEWYIDIRFGFGIWWRGFLMDTV